MKKRLFNQKFYLLAGLFLFFIIAISSVYALVQVSPASSSLTICPGTIFPINVSLSGVSGVYGFQFDLSYSSSVLEVVNVTEGPFLSNNKQYSTSWIAPLLTTLGLIKGTACTRQGSVTTTATSGVLATINFRLKSITTYPATSSLTLSNVKLSNINSQALDSSKQDGSVTITSCPVCTNGATRSCTASNGCTGTQTCTSGAWGTCTTTQNRCDTNCDGTLDSCISGSCTTCACTGTQTRACTTTNGCTGTQACVSGQWGTCTSSLYYCDSDCDGDSECVAQNCAVCQCTGAYNSQECTTSNGCAGRQPCVNGVWGACEIIAYYCDNNCDGTAETCSSTACRTCTCMSGSTTPCGTDTGECVAGVQRCVNGAWSTTCEGSVSPTTEICDNKDNDCDATTDETFTNKGQACYVGVGACRRSGTYVCNAGGTATTCNAVAGTPTTETCNNLDDDCDGSVDESLTRLTSNQAGLCSGNSEVCSAGAWIISGNNYVPVAEICDNRDNNCNGLVDDGLSRAASNRAGLCSGNNETCSAGVWSAATTNYVPVAEICDNKDNNCNSLVDDGLGSTTCGSGVCLHTVINCVGGATQTCNPLQGSSAETCNNLDDDCDGQTDESLSQPSTNRAGRCSGNTDVCSAGSWIPSSSNYVSQNELCNNLDDDCDSSTDEGLGTSSCGLGICLHSVSNCVGGVPVTCNPLQGVSAETCNNLDDDCDGQTDESLSQPSTNRAGRCSGNTDVCSAGSWIPSSSNYVPVAEICDNYDNDCDGSTDEGCNCVDGTTRPCGSNIGECKLGTQTCISGNWGSSCVGSTNPVTETCNNKDDDCDGVVDEDLTRSTTNQNGMCAGNSEICSAGSWTARPTNYVPVTETCDGKDNNCNSQTDEGLGTTTCGQGACLHNTNRCVGGIAQICDPMQGASVELCNNIDDDCNGQVDDILPRQTSNQNGLCIGNTETCSSGSWVASTNNYASQAETCDNQDDDCDGTKDNGLGSTTCGQGVCSHSVNNCVNGSVQICNAFEGAVTETCNNRDDDCDGSVDEELTRLTSVQSGLCLGNNESCSAGSWIAGATNYVPVTEACDGRDNDCDGSTDEGCNCTNSANQSCTASNGCAGTQVCTNGQWTTCNTNLYYCDDDCDGDSECVSQNCETCTCRENWDCGGWSTCDDGYQSRSCTDANSCGTTEHRPTIERSCYTGTSSSGSGGGSGSGGSSSSCAESWICANWGLCEADGFRRRTCSDANSCGTVASKPLELETCLYQGNCADGAMNGDETGVDCGGSCAPCPEVIVGVPIQLSIKADSINAEILDTYRIQVTVENTGQQEATNLVVVANKWTRENATIKSILPATSEQGELLLNLPADYTDASIEVQVVQNGILVASKTVPVQLQVPPFNVKLGWDAETGKVYKAVVIDNRDKPERNLKVDFTVYKGKETYIIDTGSSYAVPTNQVFHSIDYLYQIIPSGQYVVNSTFYEKGEPIGQATSFVILGGERKGFNVKFLFYFLLLAIVGVCGYVFFLSQRKEND